MSRLIVLAVSGFLASAFTVAPSFADDGNDHICHTRDGSKSSDITRCCYNPNRDGPTNDEAYPFCPGLLEADPNVGTLDRTTVAHQHVCQAGVNCGPPAELSNVKPFFDGASTPVPASVPAPQPVAYVPPPPPPVVPAPVAAVPAPAVYAPVQLASSGLGSAGLIAAGVGALAVAGIVALVASDDDDDAAASTPSTN